MQNTPKEVQKTVNSNEPQDVFFKLNVDCLINESDFTGFNLFWSFDPGCHKLMR